MQSILNTIIKRLSIPFIAFSFLLPYSLVLPLFGQNALPTKASLSIAKQVLIQDKSKPQRNQRDNEKAAGEILYEADFDGSFNGWYTDSANRPQTVSNAYLWVWDTDFDRGSLMASAQFNSPTIDNGAAFFNANKIRESENDITAIESPAWAGLSSPALDLSNVPTEDIPNIQLEFYQTYRQCCSFQLEMRVDISFDGGANYTSRYILQQIDRNRTASTERQIIPIGTLLQDAPELDQVVFRFTWDSETPDPNGQTSTDYYWAIDDITLLVAPETNLELTAGYNGNPVYEFDYQQIPQGLLKNYPLSASVANYGSKTSAFTCTVELSNAGMGVVKTYTSETVSIGSLKDSTLIISSFTDFDPGENLLGKWDIRYWITPQDGTADFETNERDTITAPPVYVTPGTWSHAGPWTGEVLFVPPTFTEQYPSYHAQRYRVPENVDSMTISGFAIAYHDRIEQNEGPFYFPMEIQIRMDSTQKDSLPNLTDKSSTWYYYNSTYEEYLGTFFLNEENRLSRLTQTGDSTETKVRGSIARAADSALVPELTLVRSSPHHTIDYWLSSVPNGIINYAASGFESDRATLVCAQCFSSNEFINSPSLPVPMFQFTVEEVWIDGENTNTDIAELETANLHFNLYQNIPNPSYGETQIPYELATKASVSLTLRDIAGKTVVDIPAEQQTAGRHSYTISADELNSGIYFYTLTVDGKSVTKKMVVNK